MAEVLLCVHGVIWGIPLLLLMLGTGCYITWTTGFVQIRLLPA